MKRADNSYTLVTTSDVFVASTCVASTATDIQVSCDSFTWIDGVVYLSDNNSATYTIASAGSNACDSLITLNLTINSAYADVTNSGNTLTANATGAIYRWMDCNNNYTAIPGETARTFIASGNGSYAVEVIENGCTDTSACTQINMVGNFSIESTRTIKLFPNPGHGILTLDFGDFNNVTFQVYDIAGHFLFKEENINEKSKQFELSVSSGIYFVEVNAAGFSHRFKWLVW